MDSGQAFSCEHLLLTISISYLMSHRSSRLEVLCEKGVLENFTKFAGKQLCQSLFFNKFAGLAPSGVISNNRFPFSNFLFIICQQSRLQKQNISYIFFTYNKFPIEKISLFERWQMPGKCIYHIN